jgi:hypothetical protein
MKPTPQANQNERSFPLTDYAFQAVADAPVSAPAPVQTTQRPSFHTLSREVFAKSNTQFVAEAAAFIAVAAVAALSILPMLTCLVSWQIVY